MNRELFQPVLALLIGTGIGGLLCVAGQRQLNRLEIEKCLKKSTHQLITMRSWIGDTKYCVDKKYLN